MTTRLTRRTMSGMLAALAASPAQSTSPQTTWPQTTLIVPFPPGGSSDALAPLLAAGLQPRLGASVIVENKPGAAGSIGAAVVARGEPNGSTFLVTFDSHALLGALIENPSFDVEKDLEPVLLVGTAPYAPIVRRGPQDWYWSRRKAFPERQQQPGRSFQSNSARQQATKD
jgi:tripartite-type tricarboxylate transporter receptor subunit TctC